MSGIAPRYSFPYSASNAAEAVRLFFAEQVQAHDPIGGSAQKSPVLADRVRELVASLVADRLCVFWDNKPFGRQEEMAFSFKGTAFPQLVSPVAFTKDLEYRFCGVTLHLRTLPAHEVQADSDTWVLRVSPKLVTFAGHIVWVAPPEENTLED